MEIGMRLFVPAVMIAISGIALSSPAVAQLPDDVIAPQSMALQAKGKASLAAGKFDEAESYFESALAADPRNRSAYVDIARVAEHEHLYGKAVQMTNKALSFEPNDTVAIAVQGQAMAELGAIARAQANLAKLKQICTKGCPEIAQLEAAIARGPVVATAAASKADTASDKN
jgi:tetratricopeptide (TPR) repeat protein